MRLIKRAALAGLIVALVPFFALFVVQGQKNTLNREFLSAIANNDPSKIAALQQRGITFEKFCADDQKGQFEEVCSEIRTQQYYELAAYATLGLGFLALVMSVFTPIIFGANRDLLAIVFNPTVRLVTFAVGVAVSLQGLLAAYAVYLIEVEATHRYHPKIIAIIGAAGVIAGFLVLRATFSIFRSHPILAFAQKVESTQSKRRLRVGLDATVDDAVAKTREHIQEVVSGYTIPDSLSQRFNWLASGDVNVKQQLLNHLQEVEKRIVVEDARQHLPVMLDHLRRDAANHTHRLARTLKVGKHELEILIDRGASGVHLEEWRPQSSGKSASLAWLWWLIGIGLILFFVLRKH